MENVYCMEVNNYDVLLHFYLIKQVQNYKSLFAISNRKFISVLNTFGD